MLEPINLDELVGVGRIFVVGRINKSACGIKPLAVVVTMIAGSIAASEKIGEDAPVCACT